MSIFAKQHPPGQKLPLVTRVVALALGALAIAALIAVTLWLVRANANSLEWGYAYDDSDRLAMTIDPAGRKTKFRYETDGAKWVRKITRIQDEGPTVTREFDEAGRLTRMTDDVGAVTYEYDERSRVTRVRRADTPAVSYQYDTMNRVTRLEVGDIYHVGYVYDFLGRLASMKTPVGEIRYEHLSGQGKVIRTLPNQVRTIWEYEPNGRLRQILHADAQNVILAAYSYGYSPDGLISEIVELSSTGQVSTTYEYDKVGRLITARGPKGRQESYSHDSFGNRVKSTSSGHSGQTYAYDWAGRVVSTNAEPSAHDGAGNVTSVRSNGKQLKFRHTQDGQLAAALDGEVTYRYDGDGRLIARRAGLEQTAFVPDYHASIWRPLVMGIKGAGQTTLIWEDVTPIIRIKGGKPEYLLEDYLGSIRLVVDSSGHLLDRIGYDSFGIADHAPDPDLSPGFLGLFWDPLSGVYLTRTRAYLPGLGRFLQVEPSRGVPLGSQERMSLYTYCGGDPVNYKDHDGAERVPATKVVYGAEPIYTTNAFLGVVQPIQGLLNDQVFNRWDAFWNHPVDQAIVWQMIDKAWTDTDSKNWGADNKARDQIAYHAWKLMKGWRENPETRPVFYTKDGSDVSKIDQYWQIAENYYVKRTALEQGRTPGLGWKATPGSVRAALNANFAGALWTAASFIGLTPGVSYLKDENRSRISPAFVQHLVMPPENPKKPDESKLSYYIRWTVDQTKVLSDDFFGRSKSGPWLRQTQDTHNFQDWGTEDGAEAVRKRNQSKSVPVPSALRKEMEVKRSDDLETLRSIPWLIARAGASLNPFAATTAYAADGDTLPKNVAPSKVGGIYLGSASHSLSGIGRIDGVLINQKGDLVLLSQAGSEIKLPALRLDDVVIVFRSVYLHGEGPSVTIDPRSENPRGPEMIIRHGKATESTYVGWVLYQADRLMKGYTLGEDNITKEKMVSEVPSYEKILDKIFFGGENSEMLRKREQWERFWIVPAETQRFNASNNELTLFDVPLKVKTQTMKWRNGKLEDDPGAKSSPGALAFTEWFKTNYDLIAAERYLTPPVESGITAPVPVFTELRRVALITAIAEKLRDQGVPLPFWMRDYEVRPVPFEKVTPSHTVTRNKGHVTSRIYGGVSLSTADESLKTFTPTSDVSRLPQQDAASVRTKLKLADALESAVRAMPVAVEPLQVQTFTHQASSYQTVALPGSETRALSPNRLEVMDLEAPVEGTAPIRLVRNYNSFFNPGGAWGKGWAMDLPRLDPIQLPLKRTDKGVQYQSAFELITPLNSRYARFSRFENVPMLGGSRLLVPDQPSEFFGVAQGTPEFLNVPTQKLLRKDGGAWHFSKTGELLATEQNGSRVVYERDGSGRLTRMVGLLGRRALASIELRYDGSGRIESATAKGGKREVAVRYEYDDSGRLAAVLSTAGRVGYHYDGTLLTAIGHQTAGGDAKLAKEVIVRRFEYGPRGRLLAEFGPDGVKTEYRVATDASGSSVTVGGSGKATPSDSMRYDHASRPVEARYADGSRAAWSYPETGGAAMVLTQPSGRVISMTEAADQRSRTVQLAPNRKLVADYDMAGRLTSISDNGRPSLQQVWSPDGRLTKTANETSAANFEYDRDGLVARVLLTPPGESGTFKVWQATRLDPAGRPLEITDYRGLQSQMSYGSAGELLSMVTRRDGQNYGFRIDRDDSGRVREVKSSWGVQKYSYDAAGSLTKVEEERNGQKSLAEWEAGALRKLRQFDGGEFTFAEYAEGAHAGLPISVSTPNGLKLAYFYDESNRLINVDVGSVYRLRLAYDEKGRLAKWGYHNSHR